MVCMSNNLHGGISMNQSEFLRKFEVALDEENETITPTTDLDDLIGWDSIGKITFMSFLDSEFGINISDKQLNDFKNVSDIIALIQYKFN